MIPSGGALRHVLFTGGGSAGHVVPCMPLIERLRARGVEVSFVGSRSGLEERLIAPLGIGYFGIATGKLRRYWSVENVLDIGRIVQGVVEAWRVVGRLRPNVVFSKGGFVSFPVVVAAWLRGIPVVAHESDLTPGLANRLAMPFVRVVCTTFPETRFSSARVRHVHTGTPLRAALIKGSAARGRAFAGVDDDSRVLLVVGGSLGAETLNTIVRDTLMPLVRDYHVVHICGEGRTDPRFADVARYRQFEYVADGWGDLLAAADLVVSRAGANSVYELVVLRKPNLLVPLSERASRGDQIANARYAERHGWSMVVEEEGLTPTRLESALAELSEGADQRRQTLAGAGLGDGTDAVLQLIEQVAKGQRPRRGGGGEEGRGGGGEEGRGGGGEEGRGGGEK